MTVESKDTFRLLGMVEDAADMSESLLGNLSKAAFSPMDVVVVVTLAAMDESEGKENRSYAPSNGSEDAEPVVLAPESLESKVVQADDNSNLEGNEEDLEDAASFFSFSANFFDVGCGLEEVPVLSFKGVVYCTDRLSKIMSSCRLFVVDNGVAVMAP